MLAGAGIRIQKTATGWSQFFIELRRGPVDCLGLAVAVFFDGVNHPA
jgi:hypothetical protein